jgi:hypothetical protein
MTILDRIKLKYSDVEGIDEAANIAEALAIIGDRPEIKAEPIADVLEMLILDAKDGDGKHTVLYTDGTFIINDLDERREAHVAEYGAVVEEYDPLCRKHPYDFMSKQERPWHDDASTITAVKIGSPIKPVSMNYWFDSFTNALIIDCAGIDTSDTVKMESTFAGTTSCAHIVNLDFDTRKVRFMDGMFASSTVIVLDLHTFDTSNVAHMDYMFTNCSSLTDIVVNDTFVTSGLDETGGQGMFNGCVSLSGYSSEHIDEEYARIGTDGAPGYFKQYVETVFTFDPNGGGGTAFTYSFYRDTDAVFFPECPFTPPAGKVFAYWILPLDEGNYAVVDDVVTTEEHIEPGGPRDYGSVGDQTFYAGWVDTE